MVITWSTQKTSSGYEFRVITVEYEQASILLKTGTLPTRAKAMGLAKKWKMYFQALANRGEQLTPAI